MFGQPMMIGLKTSHLPDDILASLNTEEELAEVVNSTEIGGPGEGNADDANLNNDGIEETQDDSDRQQDIEHSEACAENLNDLKMKSYPHLHPCVTEKTIGEKRKWARENLEKQATKMTRLSRQMFPPGMVGDTV